MIDLGAAHGFLEPLKSFTPAYQSPEQARGIVDYRSDLYSLGVLLFVCLTGKMPLGGGSGTAMNGTGRGRSMEDYRQAHMLDTPLRLSECNVSEKNNYHTMLDKIIARLLVKNAEERYQTAAGLVYDLECLLQAISSNDDSAEWELGSHEVPFTLILPTNQLIGRSQELEALESLYQQCIDQNDKGAFAFLEGKPGVGKSALVHAFSSRKQNPFFFSYKFNQYGVRPVHAITSMMNALAQQIVSLHWFDKDDKRRNDFIDRLCACDVLRSLVDMVPSYRALVPEPKLQPLPEGVAKTSSEKLLYPAVEHLLRTTRDFCGKEAPLCLFFDDVQVCPVFS